MFEYTFKMFSKGSATVPARGMGEIPRQIAQRLPEDSIRLGTRVSKVDRDGVMLGDGQRIEADAVVVATDGENASKLIPESGSPAPSWRSTVTLYFSAPKSPLNEPIIALRGSSDGIVNNVSVPSDLSPHYAPGGKALVSVSVLGNPAEPQLVDRVQRELTTWFGCEVDQWEHLASYRIRKALPEQLPSQRPPRAPFRIYHGIYVCGDHCSTASIEGAVSSGLSVADAILAAP
ncbi:MAG: protoporphyrinogen oxidase [Verrucomicrobiales bacterium]|jgi:protoporphyrinogen oxidase